jgi:shikimate dehydrogenase
VVTSKTLLLGLIGDPLDHSISPQIQNAAYAEMGLDAVYVCLRVTGDVPSAVKAAAALGLRGLNVTIPYKSVVMDALDMIDPLAEKVGAVNVISFDNGIAGFNTDVSAAVRSLREGLGGSLKGLKSVLVGAGGSARALAFGLASEGATVVIANRTPARSAQLAEEVARRMPSSEITSMPLQRDRLGEALRESDLLINATPVGMYPRPDGSIVNREALHRGLLVMDLVYNPPRTRLLREAEKAGCRTVGGLMMLVYQAIDSIRIWTGREPGVETLLDAATEALSTYPH